MNGTVAVLNAARGDMKFNFNSGDEEEVQTAREVVRDMLRRGYIITVTVDGKMERVTNFDPKTDTYDVTPPVPAATGATASTEVPGRRGRGRPRKVAASSAQAVAIGRTAGGGFGGTVFLSRVHIKS